MTTMKAARLTGIRQCEIKDVPMPELKPGWVIIRISRVGVCGSDIHYYTEGNIGDQIVEYPFIIGHECSGTIEELGEGVIDLRPGMRVHIDPAISCGQCRLCKMGRENVCLNTVFLGCPGQIEGCLSEFIAMPAENCYPVPDSMTFDEAVMIEPFAIAVHSVELGSVQSGDSVAVLGSGPIGLLTMMMSLYSGAAKVFSTDIVPERVEFARTAGASQSFNYNTDDVVGEVRETTKGGVDIAFECAGKQETLDQAMEALRPGGRLMILGIPGTDRISFVADNMRRHEILIQNVRRQNHNVEQAIQLVEEKKVDVGRLVTHHFPLRDVDKAFDLVSSYRDGVIKAMIDMEIPK